MGTEQPPIITVGHWINPTERIVELTQFKYGWRADVLDQQTQVVRRIKQTDADGGLEVVGFRGESFDAPVTLPWPVEHAPVEELEAELAADTQNPVAGDTVVQAPDTSVPEGKAGAEVSGDTSARTEVGPIAEVSDPVERIKIVKGPDANGTIHVESGVPTFPQPGDAPVQPPPGPTGYQPAAGEGVTSVFVTAAEGDTSVSATLNFPAPRPWAEAQPAVADLVEALRIQVRGDQQPEPSQPVGSALADPSIGRKPSGETFLFRPTSAITTGELAQGALGHAGRLGLPVDQIVVWDNRVGFAGLEGSPPGEAWGIAAIKAVPDSPLATSVIGVDGVHGDVGPRALAYVGLNADTLRHTVTLTKLGQAVVASLTTPQEVVNQ